MLDFLQCTCTLLTFFPDLSMRSPTGRARISVTLPLRTWMICSKHLATFSPLRAQLRRLRSGTERPDGLETVQIHHPYEKGVANELQAVLTTERQRLARPTPHNFLRTEFVLPSTGASTCFTLRPLTSHGSPLAWVPMATPVTRLTGELMTKTATSNSR